MGTQRTASSRVPLSTRSECSIVLPQRRTRFVFQSQAISQLVKMLVGAQLTGQSQTTSLGYLTWLPKPKQTMGDLWLKAFHGLTKRWLGELTICACLTTTDH